MACLGVVVLGLQVLPFIVNSHLGSILGFQRFSCFIFGTLYCRWTINLALKTAEKMFYAETPFNAEDLVEVSMFALRLIGIKLTCDNKATVS